MTPAQYDKCVRAATVSFDGPDADDAMRAAADELRGHPAFESVREETRQEAYEHFKEIFKDQPELVKLARPEALPASVYLVARKGTTAKQHKTLLEATFPDAQVTIQDWCPPPE